MDYPPPPAVLTQLQSPRGRRAIQVGSVLLAIGGALFILGVVVAVTSLSKISQFQRVRLADGSGTVTFASGGYTLYYEAPDLGASGVPYVGVTLTSPSGTTSQIVTPYGRSAGSTSTLTYRYGGYDGIALYTFHISETGAYHVAVSASPVPPPYARIAFGGSIGPGHANLLLIVGGAGLGIAGFVALIVGLVSGSRHKRELATAVYWQPYWQQQAWQQQPWQQQPWQQQPWQQQPWQQQPPPGPPPPPR